MANTLKIKRGAAASIPTGQLAEPLFTSDTYDLYIGTGASNQRFQKYIASGTSSQFLKGDGSLDSNTYQTALTFSSPLVNTSGTISIPAATGSVNGYLTSTDWTTFNAKEPAITAGTTLQYYRGDKTFQTLDTAAVPENGAIYFTEPRVRATVLTGLNLSGGGTIAATDSILQAFGKVQNQISALVGGATYQGVWNASTNTPTLTSGTGTKGYYYVVSVAGSTNLDGITDWKVGDWAIFNGTTWDKVDNTDAVSSVNGFTGAVNLALDNISDVSAASPTNAQLLRFNGTSSLWENWTPTFEPALTKGNLTEATSSVLTITGGTGAVIGSGTSIEVKQASGSVNGYLSSTDWSTFNGKQAQLNGTGFVKASGTIISYDNSTYLTTSSAASTYVPYTGATSSVTLGNYSITAAGGFYIDTKNYLYEGQIRITDLVNKYNYLNFNATSSGHYINSGFYTGGSQQAIYISAKSTAGQNVTFNTDGTTTFSDAVNGTSSSMSSTSTATAFIPTGSTVPTNGMYLSAANTLSFSTNSTRAITIDAGQKVGIGADPISAYRLYVNGDINVAGTVYGSSASFVGTGTFSSTVTATAFIVTGSGVPSNGIYLSAANTLALSSGSSQRMILNSSGNIGINTNAPVGRLHVHHSSDTDSRIVVTNSTTGNGSVGAEKGFHVVEQGNNTYLFNYQNGPIIFGTNGTENGGFRLNAGGNVGLGNTNNTYKLEVTGTTKLDGTLLTTGAATFSSSVTANGIIQAALPSGLPATFELYDSGGGTNLKYWRIESRSTDASYKYFNISSFNDALNSLAYGMRIRVPAGSITPDQVLFPNGNVGIGTASVTNKLIVVGSETGTQITTPPIGKFVNTGNTFSKFIIGSDNANYDAVMSMDNNATLANTKLRIYIGNGTNSTAGHSNDQIVLQGNGNVGIGTSSPSALLNTYSATTATQIIITGADTTNQRLEVTDGTVTNRFGIFGRTNGDAGTIGTQTNHALVFNTNNAERMRITSGGNVGIGTTTINASSGYKMLKINGATTGGEIVLSGNDVEYGYLYANSSVFVIDALGSQPLRFRAGNQNRMDITTNGEVIVGTTDQGAYNLQCNGTGVWGAGAYVNGSDITLKENILDIEKALDLVLNLKPKSFQYKEDYSKDRSMQTGFIAQDLLETLKDQIYVDGIVSQGKNHLNVAYQNLIPLLTKAIQELKAEIDTLKK